MLKILKFVFFIAFAKFAAGQTPLTVEIPTSKSLIQVDESYSAKWNPGKRLVNGKSVYRTVPVTHLKFIANQENGSILATIARISISPGQRNYVADDQTGRVFLYISPSLVSKHFGAASPKGNWVISGQLGTQNGQRIIKVFYLSKTSI